MNDKLRADLIGARLCGWDGYVTLNDMDTLKLRRCEPERPRGSTFSISNKADRMDVVETLGDRHEIGVMPWRWRDYSGTQYKGWRVWTGEEWLKPDIGFCGDELSFERHEEATRAALLTLADEYLRR